MLSERTAPKHSLRRAIVPAVQLARRSTDGGTPRGWTGRFAVALTQAVGLGPSYICCWWLLVACASRFARRSGPI